MNVRVLKRQPFRRLRIHVLVVTTEEDGAWLSRLTDINGHEILLADGAVRRRLDHVIRQEVTGVLRAMRSTARHRCEVLTPFGARLPEDRIRREEIRVRETFIRILIERVRITRDQLLNLDVVLSGKPPGIRGFARTPAFGGFAIRDSETEAPDSRSARAAAPISRAAAALAHQTSIRRSSAT